MSSSLYVPSLEAGWIPSQAKEVGRQLREGNGILGWNGDPRLELAVGRLTDRQGNIVSERLVVWLHKDGQKLHIGHWKMDELHRIIPDLVTMNPAQRGHVPVIDRIESHNEAIEKAAEEEEIARHEEMADQLHFSLGPDHDGYGPDRPWRHTRVDKDVAEKKD